MTNPTLKKHWTKDIKEIRKNIKYLVASEEKLSKMSVEDLRKYFKKKINIWQLLTTIDQDRTDEYIDNMSKSEILKDLKYYEEQGSNQTVGLLVEFIKAMV